MLFNNTRRTSEPQVQVRGNLTILLKLF